MVIYLILLNYFSVLSLGNNKGDTMTEIRYLYGLMCEVTLQRLTSPGKVVIEIFLYFITIFYLCLVLQWLRGSLQNIFTVPVSLVLGTPLDLETFTSPWSRTVRYPFLHGLVYGPWTSDRTPTPRTRIVSRHLFVLLSRNRLRPTFDTYGRVTVRPVLPVRVSLQLKSWTS